MLNSAIVQPLAALTKLSPGADDATPPTDMVTLSLVALTFPLKIKVSILVTDWDGTFIVLPAVLSRTQSDPCGIHPVGHILLYPRIQYWMTALPPPPGEEVLEKMNCSQPW